MNTNHPQSVKQEQKSSSKNGNETFSSDWERTASTYRVQLFLRVISKKIHNLVLRTP